MCNKLIILANEYSEKIKELKNEIKGLEVEAIDQRNIHKQLQQST